MVPLLKTTGSCRMRRGEFEDVWGPTEGEEETEEEIEAWVEINRAGRATVSIQGFHHFLKPEIFRGLANGESEVVVSRDHFDKISVRMPTFLSLSAVCDKRRKIWRPPQIEQKSNKMMATDGSSVFKLHSVQFGEMVKLDERVNLDEMVKLDERVNLGERVKLSEMVKLGEMVSPSSQPTSTCSHFLQFPVNPLKRNHLKIDIRAQYVKADVYEGKVS